MQELVNELNSLADPDLAKHSQRFFKTGKGDYGEGDKFLGIRVPLLRKLASQYRHLTIEETKQLLVSSSHEIRLIALFILTLRYERSDQVEQGKVVDLYLGNTRYINNWDLVDASAHKILGDYLLKTPSPILRELAHSHSMWERRISVVATYSFIRAGFFDETLALAKILLTDKEDLIHKAVGWMLREVGKRNLATETLFLDKHVKEMPRTMLRYAIEKFPEDLRQHYLTAR